jgi:hypothetical protein
MSGEKVLGQIKIEEIKENGDGTCTIIYEVPDDLKDYLKQYFGWKRWSSKKFNQFFLEALMKNAETMERESRSSTVTDQHSVNVPNNQPIQSNS